MKHPDSDAKQQPVERPLPRMMIAFIVRRCTIELGHPPTPAEFAVWANAHADEQSRHLFGRPISEREAGVILKHQARLVSAKSARPEEEYVADAPPAMPAGNNVIALADARLRARPKRRTK